MKVLAVTADAKALWEVTLVLGVAIVVVVIGMLTLLVNLVRNIDDEAVSLWTVTKRLAQNTTGLYQFAGTASILRALREEALRQDKLLSGLRGQR